MSVHRAAGRDPTPVLEVLEPGLLSTVQDAGRPDAARWGVPRGGAADPDSLAIANALLDNALGAPALELTLAGPVLRALVTTTVALAGADPGAHVAETGHPLHPGSSMRLRAGTTLVLAGPAIHGLRSYLAVPGGLVVTPVLGSASTALGAGFGGLDGRGLLAGDVLVAGSRRTPAPARWPGPARPATGTLRVTPGPHATGTGDALLVALSRGAWAVDAASDRMGIRLAGAPISHRPDAAGDLPSFGVLPGAIQVPPDGRPIVLLADAQPTGGYPVPGVVIAADAASLGQLRPGDPVAFEVVDAATARDALRAGRAAFEAALAHLREDRTWDELAHEAGG